MPSPNTVPLKNPTPREQFREVNDNITQHRNMVDSPVFGRAVHTALLEYQLNVTKQIGDGASSMAGGYKLQGAIEIMGLLRMLAESAPIMPRVSSPQLNHSV